MGIFSVYEMVCMHDPCVGKLDDIKKRWGGNINISKVLSKEMRRTRPNGVQAVLQCHSEALAEESRFCIV